MLNKIDEKDKILSRVQKPTRYTGGEYNSIVKDPQGLIRVAFCFPDIYDVGMSNLAVKILYGILNQREDTYCERVFAPWVDMERAMRENNIALYGLESGQAITDFDILAFTLQYEMSYSNVINMLDLAGVPLRSIERTGAAPFVWAGGPCAYNPEPLAEIVDFFLVGEGEEAANEIMDIYATWKKGGGERDDFLRAVCAVEGVYVPKFYDVSYNQNGTVKNITPKHDFAPPKINKRVCRGLDSMYFPTDSIVPFGEIIHDRIVLEIFRGCTRGCRFCQAGFVWRPVRERSVDKLLELAKELVDNTGYDEISLCSLSTSDYSEFNHLCNGLISITQEENSAQAQKVSLSLPSLRLDNFSLDIMQKVQNVRKSGLTFAPEAGTQRLRHVINKNITEEDLRRSVALAFGGGWSGVKLYFMIGLPTEEDEDIRGIAQLAQMVADEFFAQPKDKRRQRLAVTVSTSTFVPKPHTPFQWEAQQEVAETERKQDILKKTLNRSWGRYNWHDARTSFLEGVFSRGDRRLSNVLIAAHKKGCKFDGWEEFFDFDAWMEAFADCGIDPYFYTSRRREYDEVLPWEHIDAGVSKEFLMRESERARSGIPTPPSLRR